MRRLLLVFRVYLARARQYCAHALLENIVHSAVMAVWKVDVPGMARGGFSHQRPMGNSSGYTILPSTRVREKEQFLPSGAHIHGMCVLGKRSRNPISRSLSLETTRDTLHSTFADPPPYRAAADTGPASSHAQSLAPASSERSGQRKVSRRHAVSVKAGGWKSSGR